MFKIASTKVQGDVNEERFENTLKSYSCQEAKFFVKWDQGVSWVTKKYRPRRYNVKVEHLRFTEINLKFIE